LKTVVEKSNKDGYDGRTIRESHRETHTKGESETLHSLHGKIQWYQATRGN
jgi:hypothetical protein